VHWFNSVQPGGDATLPDFKTWARSLLDRGLVHPGDADAWRATFIDVEGGGRDCTWRIVMVTAPCATLGDNSDDRDASDVDSSDSGDKNGSANSDIDTLDKTAGAGKAGDCRRAGNRWGGTVCTFTESTSTACGCFQIC
jgi:hypothetical protein